jgi:hypothetical protein
MQGAAPAPFPWFAINSPRSVVALSAVLEKLKKNKSPVVSRVTGIMVLPLDVGLKSKRLSLNRFITAPSGSRLSVGKAISPLTAGRFDL